MSFANVLGTITPLHLIALAGLLAVGWALLGGGGSTQTDA